MMRPNGFLLIEVLACTAMLAVAVLAAAETLSAVRSSARRSDARAAIADCADQKLAMTLMGSGGADLHCDSSVRVEMNSALPTGDVEQVTWRISSGEVTETFTGMRYAR